MTPENTLAHVLFTLIKIINITKYKQVEQNTGMIMFL